MKNQKAKSDTPKKPDARQERLAQALRQNLRRRKEQGRAREDALHDDKE